MGRHCKIDDSPNRAEYEELRLKKRFTYRQIAQLARNKYKEDINVSAIGRHFRLHVDPYMKGALESDKLKRRIIKERMQKTIEATSLIIRHLQSLSNQLTQVEGNIEDPNARKETRDIIRIADAVLKTALNFKDELVVSDGEKTDEDVYDKLRYAVENLSARQQREVLDRFENYRQADS